MTLVIERACCERSNLTGSGFSNISHFSRTRLDKA
jgi:hypothetical protein